VTDRALRAVKRRGMQSVDGWTRVVNWCVYFDKVKGYRREDFAMPLGVVTCQYDTLLIPYSKIFTKIDMKSEIE